MKETSFIDQNKKKWLKFQQLASNDSAEPETLADLYTDLTDDLSYAQSFYNKRTVRVYLNQLAQSIHNLVHQEKSESLRKLITAWKISIPLEIYRARKNMTFALCLAIFWMIIGCVTTLDNPDFAKTILDPRYITMTDYNIGQNDPLAVYKGGTPIQMFIDITINNISVAFLSFIMGILFGIGTHIMLMKNAVMVGVFQTYFYLKGALAISFLGIWLHGAFEISAIVIACGAGITLGNGILFPGSYTRLQSLQFAAKRGIKIMLSLIPFFIMAGWIEGFATRYYSTLSDWSKWLIIAFSFALIFFYFIIYPLIVARRNPHLIHESEPPIKNFKNKFNLHKVRTFAELFSDSFSYYRVHIGRIFKANLIVSFPIIIALFIIQDSSYFNEISRSFNMMSFKYEWDYLTQVLLGTLFQKDTDFIATLAWFVLIANLFTTSLFAFKHQESYRQKDMLLFAIKKLPVALLGTLMISLVVLFVPFEMLILVLFCIPLFILCGVTMILGDKGVGKNLGDGFKYSTRSYGDLLLILVLMTVIVALFAQLIAGVYSVPTDFRSNEPYNPDFLDIIARFISYVARNYTDNFNMPENIFRQVIYILFIFFTIPLAIIMLGFQFYTVREKESSVGLREEFQKFGKRRKHQETKIDFD